jgi:hypothetical protein
MATTSLSGHVDDKVEFEWRGVRLVDRQKASLRRKIRSAFS